MHKKFLLVHPKGRDQFLLLNLDGRIMLWKYLRFCLRCIYLVVVLFKGAFSGCEHAMFNIRKINEQGIGTGVTGTTGGLI